MKEFRAYNGGLIVDNEQIAIKSSKVLSISKRIVEIYYQDIKKIEFEKSKLLTAAFTLN